MVLTCVDDRVVGVAKKKNRFVANLESELSVDGTGQSSSLRFSPAVRRMRNDAVVYDGR